ncbi:uncharacterized protein LOC111301927 [Durio zibethinus]|uniref:Uncharacterized protein LOC111301927 n=1 Tax=Durio zibethinus TaxID=66656 RepID=A0A6P5ZMT5_DURZI|nr:uncharacterized protein LOC111301927 [Durio zibethinus]
MASSNCSLPPPPIFSGENYQIWAVKMKTYLSAFDLWEVVENEKEPPQLPANPIVTQMKNYSEEKAKRYKAKSCIESSVSDDIFIRIMTCETAKQAWDVLKEKFQGSDKIRQMQVLNLRREFEVLKMKESENLKEYNDRLMKIVNKIRLLGKELSDKRIVEKNCSMLYKLKSKEGLSDKRIQQKVLLQPRRKARCKQKAKAKNKEIKETKVLETMKRKKNSHIALTAKRPLTWRNIVGTDLTYNLEEQVFVETCYGTRTSSNAWLIDNGCTHYMASDINIFKELNKTCTSKVRIANSSAYATSHDESSLWHKRMGHFNYNALNFMHKNDLVLNMPTVEVNVRVCEVCQLGKQSKLPFAINKAWRAIEKLQLVHNDLCGPMKNFSLNGSRYFIAFIDDFTRMCWIYFMKQKSEVANVFWKFKAWIENQSGCKIKIIRLDNGTEYTYDRFNEFCEVAGIEHQLTATYTPQQNGVSERKNRTIMEMAR